MSAKKKGKKRGAKKGTTKRSGTTKRKKGKGRRKAKRRSVVKSGGIQVANLFSRLKKEGRKLKAGTVCATKKVPKALLPKGAHVVSNGKTASGTKLYVVRGKKHKGSAAPRAAAGGRHKAARSGGKWREDMTMDERQAMLLGGTAGRVEKGKFISQSIRDAEAAKKQMAAEKEVMQRAFGTTRWSDLTSEQKYTARNELGLKGYW